ncbi:MAG: (E)-4-hydroxy-3-methylbut-2-enyl-diphosphate synthase [Verrucomicrobiae bacterium]|nr:(E)-4-hydroxy-3-methylbut-2-enyl-diphosphate synthase [Verrucomicrobiae bacterium]
MPARYCESMYCYRRRDTRPVVIGNPDQGGVIVGGDAPVVIQSMLTCDTLDTGACVQQTLELVAAGCQMVRLTVQTVRHASNLANIAAELRKRGCNVPLVADVHFKPEIALEAVKWVEAIRINPGNYADRKKFVVKEYSDAEYAAELARVEQAFEPLVLECKRLGRALRIGVNHGSLSDRITNRYGNTPLGMVESALEFARVCRKHDFHNFKFSLKASNPKVMIQSYRLLVARLNELGPDWNYPLHLGVTEAGEGEDARIKSAIGIGSLLCDGLGDTIRVSLAEPSVNEIEVCRDLLAQIPVLTGSEQLFGSTVPRLDDLPPPFDPFSYRRRPTTEITLAPGISCGGQQPVRVVVPRATYNELAGAYDQNGEVRPEAVYEELSVAEVDPADEFISPAPHQLVTVKDGVALPPIPAFRLLAARLAQRGLANPILLKDCLAPPEPPLKPKIALLRAAIVLGSLLVDGIGDAVMVRAEHDPRRALKLAYDILQAAGCRTFKAEFIACPSCGRTLFDLQTVTARIKARTQHLKGVKIAIMGCIVNGPGEMADADFGYVGGAPGKVNLYVGKTPVRFNVPEAEAVDALVELIRQHGRWTDPGTERNG